MLFIKTNKKFYNQYKLLMKKSKEELFKLIEEKSPGAIPLLLVIRGSHAYGTSLPTSDIDYSGIFIQSIDSILNINSINQINDDKNDIVIYEIKKFMELLSSNNPNILELLATPQDCIIYKNPIFDDMILNNSSKFVSKMCARSFGGYANEQINKAKGQNKKQNWEKDKVIRKNPIDFCYLHIDEKSIALTSYLKNNNLDQNFCGLSKIPHSRDLYALFYDYTQAEQSLRKTKISKFFNLIFNKILYRNSLWSTLESCKFKGIAFEDSNSLRLSSVPYDCPDDYFIGYVSYNKDGYTQHCDDYKSYQDWLKNKNEQRWVDVKGHNQKIDGKNMMHMRRLLDMSKEIAEGKGINVRRNNSGELIDIRKGNVDLQSLIDRAEFEIKEIDSLYKNSTLPEKVDRNFINGLLVDIRKKIYNLK